MTDANCTLANKALGAWVGLKCDEILRLEHEWSFRFCEAGILVVCSPWRIIAFGRIAHADEDDGQRFGLPAPVNGVERAMELLSEMRVVSVEVSQISGDLSVRFDDETFLEVFNNSSGYESWRATANKGVKHTNVVAQGGGTIVIWDE